MWCNSGRRKCLWRQLWALLYDRKLHESDFINFVNENEKQSANGIFFGKLNVLDVNLMEIDDVIIYHLWYCTIVWSAWKTIKNLILNFLWLLTSYTVAIRWWEYRREILYVIYRCLNFNCYLQFWVDTNVLLCWFCGPCWCFDEDAFVQSTHIYLWIKFIKLHSASKAFREYRIGL